MGVPLSAIGYGGLGDDLAFVFFVLPGVVVFVLTGLIGVALGLARREEAFWIGLVGASPSVVCGLVSLIAWGERADPNRLFIRRWWLCLPGLLVGGLAMRLGWMARTKSTSPLLSRKGRQRPHFS
jgi:hypothetical protein